MAIKGQMLAHEYAKATNETKVESIRIRICALPQLRCAVALIASVMVLLTQQAESQVSFRNWQLGYPHVSGNSLTAVCWGDPGCVAVGWYGEILFSPDGSVWSRANSPLQRTSLAQSTYLWDVCYGSGVFVAVGGEYAKGRILHSPDGLTWTEAPTAVTEGFRGVAFGNGQFVAVAGTKVLTSTDGISWQSRADSPGIGKLAYGGGKWLGSAGNDRFYQTMDLNTWSSTYNGWPPRTSGPEIANIAYANGKFVAVGGWNYGSGTGGAVVKWSADGITWHDGAPDGPDGMWGVLQGCAIAHGRYVVVGMRSFGGSGHVAFSSPDAATWTRATSPSGLQTVQGSLQDVAGAEGRPFIAVASTGQIWQSADGTAWELVDSTPLDYVGKVVHADGKFVAVGGRPQYIGQASGSATIWSSPDGLKWTPFSPERTDILSDAVFGEGLWVVTGDDGGILTSNDASDWTDRSIPGTTNDLSVLVYGAGRFIAFSAYRDRIYHSEDGLEWQVSDGAPVAGVNAAAFIAGKFIAVGYAGLVLSSADGLSWTRHDIGAMDDLQSVCYGKGGYVAGALDHTATSQDGVTWLWHPNDSAPRDIFYQGGWFVSDDFRVSRDGIGWAPAFNEFPKFYRMNSIVFVDSGFVGVEGLEIWKGELTLPKPEGLTVFPGSGVEVKSQPGTQYRLRESRDLTSWTYLGDWRDGTGDFLRWPVDFAPPKGFWTLEVR